jgi:spore coat protein CotH
MGPFMKFICFLLIICALPCNSQTASEFYDSASIQDLYLEIHPSDWAALRQNFLDNTYYPAEFTWRGITISDVGVRSRGRSSRSGIKPNLKIDFNRFEEGQKFLGLKSTTLKANNADASMMKERIAMMLFERMGMAAPRETFARLYVNGLFFGLFNLIETVDKDFVKRVYNEDEGYLYEWKPKTDGGYRFEFLGDDPAAYSPVYFDPITHEKDPNPQPLVDMVRAINQSSDREFIDTISKYIDPKQFLKHIAVEALLAEYDGMLGEPSGMNNFNVYRFTGATMHTFSPWDQDLAFITTDRDIFAGVNENVLARRLMEVPEFRTFFLRSVAEAAAIMGGEGGFMDATVSSLYSMVSDAAKSDPFKQCAIDGEMKPCGPGEFEAGVEYLRNFARLRLESISYQLNELGFVPAAELTEQNQ